MIYTMDIIRHGPKIPKDKSPTGQGAGLDPDRIYIIENKGDELAREMSGNIIEVYTLPLDRNLSTAYIIVDRLKHTNTVKGPIIDERLGAYVRNGISLRPTGAHKLWADSTKSTVEGVAKEGGMFAWLKAGYDEAFDGNGITLRETVYRIGDFILEKLLNPGSDRGISISNSGWMEPFLYSVMPSKKTPEQLYFETGGAIEPVKGYRFIKGENDTFFTLQLQNGIRYDVGLEVLEDQKVWLANHGKADKVLEDRIRGV